jgi:GNAT superfamily N-acetyltransferase
MSRLEVRPFTGSDVPAAGAALAARHRRHRADVPLLDASYETDAKAEQEVSAAWAAPDSSGAVATLGGEVVGYLLGAPKADPVWGPNVWVESAGQATREAEVMRDLYATAATRWVEEGRTAHYVLTPAPDRDLVGAWFRLGFGHQHTHGIRDLPDRLAAIPTGVTVRVADRTDIPTLARLELELPRQQALAPTFSAGRKPSLEEALAEWESDFGEPGVATFVAEYDGAVVGSGIGIRLDRSSSHRGPARPENAGFLGFASVFPHARGRGAGRALGETVLTWCAEQGHSCVVTDWRATNLLSSRAWPALGFTDSFVRLHRAVGY